MKNDKVKYTVTFPSKISKILDDISEVECISKPEVMRRAIALYSYAHNEVQSNKKLCIIDKENESIVKEVLFQ